ncbi:uncharacterized protein Triagg1_6867 [Trichoderma aggressivum f. europaeum]|uniref:Cyclin-D1-binding protein 1-like N-terminal domain-containing protein n=1 Tax=Trichoderma aggressivum f. europaeum TaxID=173218 RepID=A0AAE1ID10_9HYPO|nr:hypothetical protein Triagg1_6867 [Trichoderma aggressivum f. europaeum]
MAPAPDAAALESLETLVKTAGALLKQLQDVLGEIRNSPDAVSTPATSSTSTAPLDALALARDSATLIKAHATKVSLLIINKPFTPSAISSVVRELVTGPVPGLAASVQACDSNGYTLTFRRELAWRCQRVLSELADLLQKVPKDGRVLAKENEGFGASGKGSIASTGVLWASCDKVISLANGGVSGYFVEKMNECKDTLTDIAEEMKEWGDEEPDEDDNDDGDEDDDVDDLADQVGSAHISTQHILDDLMNSHRTIPASDPDGIRPRLESSLRRLRLVILLYQAITKRRMKRLPPLPQSNAGDKVPRRLDELATLLQKLPNSFGDLACAFYELRPREIDDAMDQCFLDAFAVSELLSESWDGSRDEFTEWTEKFQKEIKRI